MHNIILLRWTHLKYTNICAFYERRALIKVTMVAKKIEAQMSSKELDLNEEAALHRSVLQQYVVREYVTP